MILALLVISALLPGVFSVQQLGYYGADKAKVSISGISSGSCFATQFHVAYSSEVMGVGVMAGAPYYCAQANSIIALRCMDSPSTIDTPYLVQVTKNTALTTNTIDDVDNMINDRVFVYGGTLDSVVMQGSVREVEEYYLAFGANIKTKYNLNAEHATPTDFYGNSCSYRGSPYINNCNYNAAYEILNHMYGGLTRPGSNTILRGDFYAFDQDEFFYTSLPSQSSMDDVGYVYVPSGCDRRFSNCKVHIAMHGCEQGRVYLGDEYARNTGYNEVAELNDIIIIYPQAINSILLGNAMGCWDWWGYTGTAYASNLAPQMIAVHRILERVLS
ncbi:poly(3-hydroxybutyrate) depolymerase-like [Ptychodera flava]|uniref:poly(3-hydroxybutyrate) depolymerase-like n=1 Tax=Ptychodera flava TaxID=63121 RepID=UPI00396A6B53